MSSNPNRSAEGSARRLNMLATGRIGPTLFKLSAPAIAGMVVMAVYNVVDTFFVSLLRDTTAIAATGIVFPIFQLIGAVGLTFGMGAASVISRRLGANRQEDAEHVAATALYSALGVGIVLAVVGGIFTKPLLTLFGATPTILDTATMYGRVIISGSVFQVLNMTTNNLLRSEGAAIRSSTGQILGAVMNIILDPIFIFVLDLGVTGAAVATVISQGISTLYLLSYYARGKGALQPLRISSVRVRWETYRDMMNLGFPTFVRQILGSVSFAILNNAAGSYGDSAIAAISVTFRLFMLFMMALVGLAQGLQPLAGYNYGALKFDRVRETIRVVVIVAISISLLVSIVALVFAPGIMRIFAPQDADVVRMGTVALRLMAVTLVPTALVIMFGGIFQALGHGRAALLLAAGQQGVFLIPLVILLPRFFGITGVFAAMPSGFFFAFLVGLVLLVGTMRDIREQEAKVGQNDT